MTPLAVAVRFLTRIPVPGRTEATPEELGRSVVFYPVVGLGIGLALAAGAWILGGGPPALVGSLVLVLWAALTGFLHLDGLADAADAWLGGHGDPERTLAILDDSRTGAAGVVAVALVLIVKVAALTALVEAGQWLLIALAPLLARAGAVTLLLSTPYVRVGGLGEAPTRYVPTEGAWAAVGASALVALLAAGATGLAAILLAGLGLLGLRWLAVRRLGGVVGDVLGAAIEIGEALVLAVLVLA